MTNDSIFTVESHCVSPLEREDMNDTDPCTALFAGWKFQHQKDPTSTASRKRFSEMQDVHATYYVPNLLQFP